MYHNRVYTDVNQALPDLLHLLESEGDEIGSRAGRTHELTHIGITLEQPLNREILLSHRKPNLAAQIAETAWVLAGRDDIDWLEHYLPRARDFSDDGKRWRAGYGARLRTWDDHGSPRTVDQWRWLVKHLQEDRASRRAVMSIWDPAIDTEPGIDIPCNDWLSFLSRNGRLDLHVALRSNDVIWGWSGINQFEWSVLLEVTAGLVGAMPGSLHFSTTSFHIYDHHWAKSAKIREGGVAPSAMPSPRFDANTLPSKDVDGFDSVMSAWFVLEQEIRTGAPVSDEMIDAFPEPMLRSWLRVLRWWWTGENAALQPLRGTRLQLAAGYSVQPPKRDRGVEEVLRVATNFIKTGKTDQVRAALRQFGVERVSDLPSNRAEEFLTALENQPQGSPFIQGVIALHDAKDAAYGASWKRRGEMLGIMANIARKIDRLGNGETADETSADTAVDLFVYLAKYRAWLESPTATDTTATANEVMLLVDEKMQHGDVKVRDQEATEEFLRRSFDSLEIHVNAANHIRKKSLVQDMLFEAYRLALHLSEQQDGDDYQGADVD